MEFADLVFDWGFVSKRRLDLGKRPVHQSVTLDEDLFPALLNHLELAARVVNEVFVGRSDENQRSHGVAAVGVGIGLQGLQPTCLVRNVIVGKNDEFRFRHSPTDVASFVGNHHVIELDPVKIALGFQG